MSSFYNRFEDEEVLAIKEFSLERGMHVACQYLSKRTGKTEWCRGTVIVKLNLGNFKIDMFDHGVIAIVHLRMLRKLFKSFGKLPKQAINAKLGGVEHGPLSHNNRWTIQEIDYFKRKTAEGQLISKSLFGVFTFFQKTNEIKSTSSKVEFLRSFFGRNVGLKKSFRNCLTFTTDKNFVFGFVVSFLHEIVKNDQQKHSIFKC